LNNLGYKDKENKMGNNDKVNNVDRKSYSMNNLCDMERRQLINNRDNNNNNNKNLLK